MSKQLLHAYFKNWMELYKQGSVRPVTYQKYINTQIHLRVLAPKLTLSDLTRASYQQLLNLYAENHEHQTVMDFHHLIKAAVLDAKDEGLIKGNPVRKAVIKGKTPKVKRKKFLSQNELEKLMSSLNLTDEVSWDWFIYLLAKTGLRFGEALALTPEDFDFSLNLLKVNKTWNYKDRAGGFQPTKNKSSVRVIKIDHRIAKHFQKLIQDFLPNQLIFVKNRVFNSLINQHLYKRC